MLLITAGLGACDYSPDGDPDVVALVGSDTTQDVMGAVTGRYMNEPGDDDYNKDPDTIRNVLSQQPTPLTVEADESCGSRTYHTPPGGGEVAPPDGSGAGRDALRTSVLNGDGCVDIARSSGAPRAVGTGSGQDLASFEYFAFGLDAVGASSASSLAPSSLTLAQIRGIYNCTFTNWNQVGGSGSGQIERYWPQAGSGTRSFFQSDVLGFDPTTFSSASCPAVQLTQENTGQTIAANGDQQTAVVPYSGANWVAAARGTQPDQRAGQTIRSISGQNIVRTEGGVTSLNTRDASHTTAPVAEDNVRLNNPSPAYPGIRYVFNVVDNTSASYQSALRYVGFENVDSGVSSPLCGGTRGFGALVTNFGFGQLDTTTGPRNLAATRCRKFTP